MKQFNFAMTDNTTYTGKDTEGFFKTALLSAPTVKNVTIVANCKDSIKLAKYDLGEIIQADGDTFNATGEGTLSQITVSTCPLRVNLSYPTSVFEQNYLNEYMKAGSNTDESAPKAFTDYIVESVAEKVSSDLEKVFWAGSVSASASTYPYNKCDGIELKLSADSATIDVTKAATSAITVSTIISEIQRVYDAIPNAILSRNKVKIYMATNLVKLYKAALGATYTGYYNQSPDLNYLGVEIVEAPGMNAYHMVAAEPDNLIWATDLISDQEDLSILPQRNVTGDRTVRMVTSFKFGTKVKNAAEVVFYW